MLPRLPYLAVSSVFTVMGLLPMSDTAKDVEILALRHQLAILQRQVDTPRLTGTDRVFLAALLHRLPKVRLRQLQLIVSPDTILRWHRDLIRRRHARISRRKRLGRPPTRRWSIIRFRAIWVTQAAVGWTVTPRILTRRPACSITAKT